ncbi:MAG: histidine kinase [Rhodoglobus sp.]|nr:histidine kinase [Rhodoglobus sp.]
MEKTLRRFARQLITHFTWVPVAGAVAYLVLWIIAEAGRSGIVEKTVVFALFAAAIALSGLVPVASLSIITAVPVLQLVGILYPPMATSWPMYAAAGFVAFAIAFRAEGIARALVLPVGVVTSLLFAGRMMLPSHEGYWTSWIGGRFIVTDRPHWENFITLIALGLGFYLAMWALGVAGRSLLRERAIGHELSSAEGRLLETDFELRLAEDRARISRDVHDALAHSLAVIVSQAEGALALSSRKPKVAGDALATIATVGRSALTDVRTIVERIHDEDLIATAPAIDDLSELIGRMRGLGMDATLQTLGERRDLSPARELAVYRIVQESLTNALKHAGASSTVRVTLDWQGPGLAILVVSRPGGDAGGSAGTRGVGIEGMKERARLAGGWLSAAPDGEGFLVTALIPTRASAPASEPEEDLVDA